MASARSNTASARTNASAGTPTGTRAELRVNAEEVKADESLSVPLESVKVEGTGAGGNGGGGASGVCEEARVRIASAICRVWLRGKPKRSSGCVRISTLRFQYPFGPNSTSCKISDGMVYPRLTSVSLGWTKGVPPPANAGGVGLPK